MENTSSIMYRPFRISDKEDCVRVFKSNIPRYFLEKELTDFEEWLDRRSRTTEHGSAESYLVVILDNVIIGCGGFHIDLMKKSARMTWGMISDHLHRKGIGTQFLLYRIRQIQNICPESSIALDTTQLAAPFFEKLGFRTTNVTKDFYGPQMDRYDMELT